MPAANSLLINVRAVVFDAVGTLIHPDPPFLEVYREIGQRFGSQRTAAEMGERFRSAFAAESIRDQDRSWRTSEAREEERWRYIVSRVLDDVADAELCFQQLYEHFSRPTCWRCDSGTAPTLQALASQGYLLCLASNFDRRLRSIVANLSQLSLIQATVISSEIGWLKPSPHFFAAVEHSSGMRGPQILYVGDQIESDYLGAVRAGIAAVLYDPYLCHKDTTTRRIEHLTDLISLKREHYC